MNARNRTADLDRLADAILGRMQDGLKSHLPDYDALSVIGVASDGRPYTPEELAYGAKLWSEVASGIAVRWAAFREAQSAIRP